MHRRHFNCIHPGGNPGANLKSISHRCYPWEVAFKWELIEEIIYLPLGCLQGGGPRDLVNALVLTTLASFARFLKDTTGAKPGLLVVKMASPTRISTTSARRSSWNFTSASLVLVILFGFTPNVDEFVPRDRAVHLPPPQKTSPDYLRGGPRVHFEFDLNQVGSLLVHSK